MEDINYPTVEKLELRPSRNKSPAWMVVIVLSVVLLGIVGFLGWLFYSGALTPKTVEKVIVATGPCLNGTENILPKDYQFYENSELAFKFAYPVSWGEVILTLTPIAKEKGRYIQGSFASNKGVSFGGNALNYTVGARGGTATDLPGYKQAKDKFYSVELWKFKDSDGTTVRDDLHLIKEKVTLKDGCNTKAAVTSVAKSEIGVAYDLARFNLQPTSEFNGVNFVLKTPTAATRVDFDKVIQSFQTL